MTRIIRSAPHIELAEQAELLVVAPATANFLAKAAHGMADDLLSTLYVAFPKPVLMAPAMNNDMWAKQGSPAQRCSNSAPTAFTSSIRRKAG